MGVAREAGEAAAAAPNPAPLTPASLAALPSTCCVILECGATSLGVSGGKAESSFLRFEVMCFQEPGRCICGGRCSCHPQRTVSSAG